MTDQTSEPLAAKPWHAKVSRRRFVGSGVALAAAAALAGYLPERVLRAQAASAANRPSFDLSQVKHLVFLMQENRSFDHYFGTFPGVRGFSDPRAIRLPTGRSVFQQPDPANPDGYLEPFHMSTITTGAAAIPDLTHNWQPQHQSLNNGLMDGWLRTHIAFDGPRVGPYTMGYHTREDIPFHWALAEAFTLLDGYHCSVLGPTDPNRAIWQNGTNDPQGLGGGPILETVTPPPLTFESGAETLFNAGITFKCYLGGGGPNTWPWFASLEDPTRGARAGRDWIQGAGGGRPGRRRRPARPLRAEIAFGWWRAARRGRAGRRCLRPPRARAAPPNRSRPQGHFIPIRRCRGACNAVKWFAGAAGGAPAESALHGAGCDGDRPRSTHASRGLPSARQGSARARP